MARELLAGRAEVVHRGAQLDHVGQADLEARRARTSKPVELVVLRERAQAIDQRAQLGAAAAGQRERLALDDRAVELAARPSAACVASKSGDFSGASYGPGFVDAVLDLRQHALEMSKAAAPCRHRRRCDGVGRRAGVAPTDRRPRRRAGWSA